MAHQHVINAPDPVDGLRLAHLQRQREQQHRLAAGKGQARWALLQGLCVGLVFAGHGLSGAAAPHWFFLVMGMCAVGSAILAYRGIRQHARAQIRQLDQRIDAVTSGPDGPVLAAAAQAARGLLLHKPA